MSELSQQAAKLAAKHRRLQQRITTSQTTAMRSHEQAVEKSREVAAEFIGKLLGANVPTLPLYGRATRTTAGLMRDRTTTTGYRYAANGWVIQEEKYDYDNSREGLFLTTDGKTYRCGTVQTTRPTDAIYDGPLPFVVAQSTTDGTPSIGGYPWLEAPYATPEGLTILANRLVKLDLD